MKIYKMENYERVSERAAWLIAAQITSNRESVLGLATGSTPVGTYAKLVEWYQQGMVDFTGVHSVNLDEYRGAGPDDEYGYYYFMKQHLFDQVNIEMENTHIPDGREPDRAKACRDYDRLIENLGGIDFQLLGLGHNGHIGFNEPGKTFESSCHCVTLADSTIKANQRFFKTADEVPQEAYTMGIGTIMKAGKILLVVSGKEKAAILRQVVEGPVCPEVPASILNLHPDVTIIADQAALSELRHN